MYIHPSLNRCLALIEQVHRSAFGNNIGLLITGLSGVGKTSMARMYIERHPLIQREDRNIIPVLYVKLTETKTAVDFLLQIVKKITLVLGKNTTKAHVVQDRLSVLLKAHRVELIIIDEVQECLTDLDGITSQRMAKQIAALIDNNPKTSIVLIGTPLAGRLLRLKYGPATHRLQGEEQLSRRFLAEQSLYPLPSRCEAWLDCCNYFATQFRLPDFSLSDKAILNRLHVATFGRPGLLEKLFSVACTVSGEVMLAKLESAYLIGINSSAYNPFDPEELSDKQIIHLLESRENR